ncbi:hypothetical protein HYS93_00710 [Candidatus Daviesbacteria bacterium]|nr:hypothetical protein [Candidatus Daviesbacteria bacterium]
MEITLPQALRLGDRYKSIKFSRKQIITSLLVAILLELLILIFIYKDAIYYDFHPATHQVSVINKKKVRIIRLGDTIAGSTASNSQVSLTFNPGNIKAQTSADSAGNWSYLVPSSLQEGRYTINIETTDQDGKTSLDSFKARIVRYRILHKLTNFNPF